MTAENENEQEQTYTFVGDPIGVSELGEGLLSVLDQRGRARMNRINSILVDVREQIKQSRREGDSYSERIEHDDEVLYGAALGSLFALGWNLTAVNEKELQDFISFLIVTWHGPEGERIV